MITVTWNFQNRQIHRNRRLVSDCQGLGREVSEDEISFQYDENVLKLGNGDGGTTVNKLKDFELDTW